MKSDSRIVFIRIGRMIDYAGPRQGYEGPEHAGKFNEKGNLGHEVFNFFDFDGAFYGTFGIIAERVNLRRIDPTLLPNASCIDGVLVIFFALYPDGQQIVGWYRNATVFRKEQPYPLQVKSRIRQHLDAEVKRRLQEGIESKAMLEAAFNAYRFRATDATLLPLPMRKRGPRLPHGLGGTGQRNVCYTHKDHTLKPAPWIHKVIDFITDYSGPNLLTAEDEIEADAFAVQERAAGFRSDAKARRAIEKCAMDKAKEELDKRLFLNLQNTSKRECYDYTCEKAGALYFVEVKGAQGTGASVILTRNEVEHWEQFKQNSIAVIVHHIELLSDGKASAGVVEVGLPWDITPQALQTVQYKWTVPRDPKIAI